jgi:hypothetical protein
MQTGTIDRTQALLEQVITHMMQRTSRLPQGRLDDHDGAVRCEKRQELRDNHRTLCWGIDRCKKQFIEAVRHDNKVVRPTPHNLFSQIAFERMFQVALDTPKS